MTDWGKVGARSRARGYRFERDVAAQLGWSRVPFSGANAAFGEGDVIDGFVNGPGYWIAECKMRTTPTGSVSVDGEWIDQARNSCERSGRWPVIIVGAKKDRQRPHGLVLLPPESARFMVDRIVHAGNRDDFSWFIQDDTTWEVQANPPRKDCKSGGFCLRAAVLNSEGWRVAQLWVQTDEGRRDWMVLRLVDFVDLIRNLDNAQVHGPHFEVAE